MQERHQEPARRVMNMKKITSYSDTMKSNEKKSIDEDLVNFLVYSKLPLEILDSLYFKKLLKSLRPAYSIPNGTEITDSLLPKIYMDWGVRSQYTTDSPGVLLISKHDKTLLSIVYFELDKFFFVMDENYPMNFSNEFVTSFITKSLGSIQTRFNVEVYAVVCSVDSLYFKFIFRTAYSDVWYFESNSLQVESLQKQCMNTDQLILEKVNTVQREFMNDDLQNEILKQSGEYVTECATVEWSTYQSALLSYRKNNIIMKKIMLETKFSISQEVKNLLVDDALDTEIKDSLSVSNCVTNLITNLEKFDCTIADAVEHWLQFSQQIEKETENYAWFSNIIKEIFEKVMLPNALAANYLHPTYSGRLFSNNIEFNKSVHSFFIENLDGSGLYDLTIYKYRKEIFANLFQKKMSPFTFWKTAATFHQNLSKLALKLLIIPANSTIIDMSLHQTDSSENKEMKSLYYALKINEATKKTDLHCK